MTRPWATPATGARRWSARVGRRAEAAARGDPRGRADLRRRAAARGAHRRQEAALRARAGRGRRGCRPARPLVRTLKRLQETLGRLHDLQVIQTARRRGAGDCRRRGRGPRCAASTSIARHARGGVPSPARPLHQGRPGAARAGRDLPRHRGRAANRLRRSPTPTAQDGASPGARVPPRPSEPEPWRPRALPHSSRHRRRARPGVSGRLEASADQQGHRPLMRRKPRRSTRSASPSI